METASEVTAPPRVAAWAEAHRVALVLALAVGLILWGTRLVVRECSAYGCVLVNRWTGSVTFQRASRGDPR